MGLISAVKKGFGDFFTPGGIPRSFPVEWFQMGYNPPSNTTSSVSEAAISAYAQTVAQLPVRQYKINTDGSRTLMPNTRATAVLNRPNNYQTRSDFMLNLIYGLLGQGNGYFYGDGQRGGVDSDNIYLLDPRATRAMVLEGDIYYATGGQFLDLVPVNPEVMIPQRFVGHSKLHTPIDLLLGVSPLRAAAMSLAAHGAIVNHQASFFANMARPSGALSTDLTLKKEQIDTLRNAWAEHSKGLNSGGVPILTAGLKWQPFTMTSQDAELVSAWKMTVAEIARVFRIPPMLIGDLENSTYNNAEQLIGVWLSTGLGFLIDHLELVFEAFFDLPPDEKIDLDVNVLLRTDRVAEMQELREGVNSGIYMLNEARARRHLAPVEGGDVPMMQAQMTPIETLINPPEPAPATAAPPLGLPEPEDEDPSPEEQERGLAVIKAVMAEQGIAA